jgi:hypothetical protein
MKPERWARRLSGAAASFALAGLLGCAATRPVTPMATGRWVVPAAHQSEAWAEGPRGLQTSGLVWHSGRLWSLGDRNSSEPKRLLEIDPDTGALKNRPLLLADPERKAGEADCCELYRNTPTPDFEALSADPRHPQLVHTVTEVHGPWLISFRIPGPNRPEFTVVRVRDLVLPPDLRDSGVPSLNSRIEGLALADDGRHVYFALERASDDLPRLLEADLGAQPEAERLPLHAIDVDFAGIPPRADKPDSKLNLNDLAFIRLAGRPHLIGVARDQERLLLVDLERPEHPGWVDLDLRAPDGCRIVWVSPEALAVDPETDRLWLLNDPAPEPGRYTCSDSDHPSPLFERFTPLLFEFKLSEMLAACGGS